MDRLVGAPDPASQFRCSVVAGAPSARSRCPGDWLQRGAVLGPTGTQPRRRGLRWPRQLRNIWLQSGAFLLLATFSTVLLTSPLVTAIVLAGMLLAAVGLSLVFERRAFCRYLCPVGGFIGLYAQVAPLELRIKDKARLRHLRRQALLQRFRGRLWLPMGCLSRRA